MRLRLLLAVLVLSSLCGAQRPKPKRSVGVAPPDPFTKVEFKNADITARRMNIPPAESVPVGAGVHDYLLISLGNSELAITGYQTNFEMKMADGEMQVLQGGWPHKIQNTAAKPAELLAIEVAGGVSPKEALCGLSAANCHDVRTGSSAEGEYQQTLLFDTELARLFRVHLGSHVAMHQHADNRKHVVIALSPLSGHVDQQAFKLNPGEVFFHADGFEDLVNDGDSGAHFLILEVK
jgi:hypothetical protein